MKRLLAYLSLVVFPFSAFAQQGKWEIKWNGKVLITADTENIAAHIKQLKRNDLKQKGFLEIKFNEAIPNAWKRSFILNDESDNELWRKDSTTKMKISIAQLKNIFRGKKQIIIYTTVSPSNPMMMVRMQHIHLCTLKFPNG